jgi:uncharacterized protein (TIGR02118 family)
MEKKVSMVRVTVLYPNEAGKRFDHAYYAGKHLPLVMERLNGSGMLRYEVDKGLAGGGPGAPAPFVAACHLYFNAAADFQKGIGAHGTEIMADIPNYTDISPQIQISEIVVG